jgi:hypothetical protein
VTAVLSGYPGEPSAQPVAGPVQSAVIHPN